MILTTLSDLDDWTMILTSDMENPLSAFAHTSSTNNHPEEYQRS